MKRPTIFGPFSVTVPVLGVFLAGFASAAGAQIPAPPSNVRLSFDPTAPGGGVTVSPTSTSVPPRGTVQFSAVAVGTSNSSIEWRATGGTISPAGLYTAGTTTGNFLVTATLSGTTISGTASVVVEAPSTGDYVDIMPGENIQAQINAMPEGTAFRLRSGVHRVTLAVVPKSGQILVGEAGAILSGARLLTATRSGAYWVVPNQTQEGPFINSQDICKATSPRCDRPEDLFIDDVRLTHVATLAEVGPGKWFFDYPANQIYFADDPTGKRVETSVTPVAIDGGASNVTIKGLVIEKFASPAQNGAIKGGNGWIIEGNDVRWNHGIGIHMRNGRRVLRNNVHHNGQMGLGGSSADALVEGNEIAYNNTAGYNAYFEAGGTKFTFSRNLVVRNNFSHHNDGPGLWTDIDNIDVLYELNRVEDNALSGIFHEISYRATIRNNTSKRNGTKTGPWWIDGCGILVANSSDVEVYGNTLEANKQGICGLETQRGSGAYGPWTLVNLYVHDNTTDSRQDLGAGTGRSGIVQTNSPAVFSNNNRYERNTYLLGPRAAYFMWVNADVTEQQWVGYGHDTTGKFIR